VHTLLEALRSFDTDDEIPNARAVANTLQTALANATDANYTVTTVEETELMLTLDRIALDTRQSLPHDLQRLRNALADSADFEWRAKNQ
jgi:hypothetical protein